MKAELEEIAEIARGASEREIETEVVHILKQSGWPRSQINQDVPISDKGADKADIVLRLDGVPMILVEVKKHGHFRDADNQVNRYCRLLRPSPKLALLTDGIRWVLFYVGQVGAIPIQDVIVPSDTDAVISMLTAFNPQSLAAALQAGAFQFLDIVEQGLQERSEDAQKHLRHFFALTVKALLMPSRISIEESFPVIVHDSPQPTLTEERAYLPEIYQPLSAQQGSDIPTEYDPFHPPPLGFTTQFTAIFSGKSAANWNDLLRLAVKSALVSGQTIQDIKRVANINIHDNTISVNGFRPLTGMNFSVQSASADQAWQNSLKLAQLLGYAIEARFHWSDNERAAYPGKRGILHWKP